MHMKNLKNTNFRTKLKPTTSKHLFYAQSDGSLTLKISFFEPKDGGLTFS